MRSAGQYGRTIRYLTGRQLFFLVWYRFRDSLRRFVSVQPFPEPELTGRNTPATFTFLHQTVHFPERIDWNYAGYGKLWTYHLNYFDTLNAPETTPETGLALMHDFISQYPALSDGREPYPTSLRLVNWVRFLRRYQILDARVEASLRTQTNRLRRRLEYHLSGNHLLENGFALLTASVYLHHKRWRKKAIRLVRAELYKQIGPDGGHYERSPAYHRDILGRLKYVLDFLTETPGFSDPSLLSFLDEKATEMQHWLGAVTFRNGDLPMLNDGISPAGIYSTRALDGYTETYRMFRQPRYELLADVGAVGPDHQPGHAHADSLSFLLYVDDRPVLVDTGTSTYESGLRRQYERSTAAHNTVTVAGQSSSEVWAVFRVGRRARTRVLTDAGGILTARHDGYRHLGLIHERSWSCTPDAIQITDRLIGRQRPAGPPNIARFHAHPDVLIQLTETGATLGLVRLTFGSAEPVTLRLDRYEVADGFNRLRPGVCLEVKFMADLVTNIYLCNSFHTIPDARSVPDILL